MQFQIYRAFCIEAKKYDPNDPSAELYKCDFFGNKKIGEKLMYYFLFCYILNGQ